MFQALDKASWRKEHWKIFIIVSLSFFLDGILFSLVPTTLFLILELDKVSLVLALNSLSFMLGSLALGRLADFYGRKLLFLTSVLIYLLASILFIVSPKEFLPVLFITSMINFGVGGEVGAAYAAMAELSPMNHRGKAIMLATNFWNIGAFFIAGLALIFYQIYADVSTQIFALLIGAILLAIVVALARLYLPESPRWLIQRGRIQEAQRVIGKFSEEKEIKKEESLGLKPKEVGLIEAFKKYRFRLMILLIITSTQLLTYNMVAYYSPYASGFIYGPESAPLIIFYANLGASIGAFLLLPLIDRTRKLSNTLAFMGGLITCLFLILGYGNLFFIFSMVLLINLIFSEWAWAALSALESELFPTGVRASTVGFITSIAWLFNTLVILVEAEISAITFLSLASLLWFIGFLATLIWYKRGLESAKKSVDELI